MAANLQSRGLASFGKRFVSQIRSRDSVLIPSLSLRRGVHVSVYDKNPEEHVRPTVVPDDVIPPQPDQYWAPHPQTGVFGPATDHKPSSGGDRGLHVSASAESVLEQKAFFRPLEDLDKPVQP
ncbi:UNVERIFIED_CONTAM: Late embryogenesis abundant protein [Sesamum latifolium]|uniref:Late embryogenesis abundant protein n=1 Tax=Sesamum latifolium TaxID=2727402 RepID=A0AAW2XEJ2_9LAMI